MKAKKISVDRLVLDQLNRYKRVVGQIKLLEKHPIGNGMYLSTINQDDQLKDLHRQLKSLPSYMYLTKHEQKLEDTAHAYLTQYPLGTQSQKSEVKRHKGADAEDEKLLKELVRKIEKVIEARAGRSDGMKGIIEKISKLQDLEQEKAHYEFIFSVLDEMNPGHGQVLKLEFGESKEPAEAAKIMGLSVRTFYRWRLSAIFEYGFLTMPNIEQTRGKKMTK